MSQRQSAQVTVFSGERLDVRGFAVREAMSELFDIELRVVSTNHAVDFNEIVGKEATFTLGTDRGQKALSGVVVHMDQLRIDPDGLATYGVTIAPRLWLATQRRNYRIFQYQSELQIAKQLLSEWGIAHVARVDPAAHIARKFRVQYAESDYDFFSRLLEDAGISFFFEATDEGTQLVLHDEPQTTEQSHALVRYHDSPGVTDGAFLTRAAIKQAVRPGRATIFDVDYRAANDSQPQISQASGLAVEQRLEQFHYEPGAFLYQVAPAGSTPSADDRGVARTDMASAARKATNRILGHRQRALVITFESNLLDLAPGMALSASGHTHRALGMGKPVLVVRSLIEGEHDSDWRVQVQCAPTDLPFRPEHRTQRPVASGIESATVVGPSSEEIHTDEYGRVRVHFHWDRESKRDEGSSCWLPTSQPWAGTGFGSVNLPRVGQEVLVEFLNGDPDRPVVVGRVYTETNPVPEKLPKYKAVSGLMSESTPRLVVGGSGAGDPAAATSPLGGGTPLSPGEVSNFVGQPGPFQATSPSGGTNGWQGSGIQMGDDVGQQMVYLQAQRDLNIVVNNSWRTIVGNRRGCMVGTDDQLTVLNYHNTLISEDQTLTIGNNQELWVFEMRSEHIRGNLSLQVGAGGFHVTSQEDAINYQAAKGLLVQAANKIELVVGSSTIVLLPGEITIYSADRVVVQGQEGGG